MIADTNYVAGSDPGTGLTEYMREEHEIRDPSSRELDGDEVKQFNDKCAKNGFSRQIVLSPDGDHLSEDELDLATRRTMAEFTKGHNSTEYVYSVHTDTDNPHVHIAATASRESQEMWLNRDDINELRDDIAANHFRDHTIDQQRDLMRDQERRHELKKEDKERELASQDSSIKQIQEKNAGFGISTVQEIDNSLDIVKTPLILGKEAKREQQHRQQYEREHNRRK